MDSGNNGSLHVLRMATGKGLLVNIVSYLATAYFNDDEGYQLQGWLVVVRFGLVLINYYCVWGKLGHAYAD